MKFLKSAWPCLAKASTVLAAVKTTANALLAAARRMMHRIFEHRENVRTGRTPAYTVTPTAFASHALAWVEDKLDVAITPRSASGYAPAA